MFGVSTRILILLFAYTFAYYITPHPEHTTSSLLLKDEPHELVETGISENELEKRLSALGLWTSSVLGRAQC